MSGISGPLALIVAAFISGAGLMLMLQPEPPDMDAAYCTASADGWRAAHVRLYDYVERTNPEYFARSFVPFTRGGHQNLVDNCMADVAGVKRILLELVARAELGQTEPVGGGTGK